MSCALLPAHTSYRSAINNLSISRVGRQQRLTNRRPQRTGGSVISNVATAPLPPPADISRPARPQQLVSPVVTAACPRVLERCDELKHFVMQEQPDLSQSPPFTLSDLKRAIPQHCWQKNTAKSVSYLVKDVAIVAGLAVAAYSANTWLISPSKAISSGTRLSVPNSS